MLSLILASLFSRAYASFIVEHVRLLNTAIVPGYYFIMSSKDGQRYELTITLLLRSAAEQLASY